jgi:hypothetical protein
LEKNKMAFIKRSEVKIVSIIDEETVDEKHLKSAKKMTDQSKSQQEKQENNKSGS